VVKQLYAKVQLPFPLDLAHNAVQILVSLVQYDATAAW
jgi:hypothetical protein